MKSKWPLTISFQGIPQPSATLTYRKRKRKVRETTIGFEGNQLYKPRATPIKLYLEFDWQAGRDVSRAETALVLWSPDRGFGTVSRDRQGPDTRQGTRPRVLADRTRDLTRDTCHLLIACARARAPFFTTCNYFTVSLNPPYLPTPPNFTLHNHPPDIK